MKTSSMFLSNLTVVDHAYINEEGDIVGGSFNPSFIVSGEIDEVEQVVIDFSTCKKDMKAIIDDKEIGIDHKLWVGGFSKLGNRASIDLSKSGDNVQITTPKWDIEVPSNAIHLMNGVTHYDVVNIGIYIGNFVRSYLLSKYPTVDIICHNNTDAHGLPYMTSKSFFRYTHGLKNSTSWGCQNIAHGHLSYINILAEDEIGATILEQKIAHFYDKHMFVWAENWNSAKNCIEYETERGNFRLTPVSPGALPLAYYSHETTIENLTESICEHFADSLKKVWASSVYISEGLTKGAVVDVS